RGHALALGAPVGLQDPGLLAVDPDDARLGREVGEQEPAPVAHAGAHVEREARLAQAEAAGHELEEVTVPPEIARLTEIFGRMRLRGGLGRRHGRDSITVRYHARMRILGTTARRVVYAILVTALIPLVAAVLTSRAIIARVSATAFQPEFGAHLDRSLGVYADLARALKREMRTEATLLAMSETLRTAAVARDKGAVEAELARQLAMHRSLVEIRVETCPGVLIGARSRGKPADPKTERTLTVRRTMGVVLTDLVEPSPSGEPGD